MEAFTFGIITKKRSLADLSVLLPRFLRFNNVKLSYDDDALRWRLKYEPIQLKSIEEKCHSIENYLQPLKNALTDSKSIEFCGGIDRTENKFSNFLTQSSLLEYLGQRLLPIFNSSHCYEFDISFVCGEGDATNVISSIIQMPQIGRCSNLHIELHYLQQPKQLPVEAISNWLNRKMDVGTEAIGRTPREIYLGIWLNKIQNAMEMCDQLAEVLFLLLSISSFYGSEKFMSFILF